MSEVVEFFEEVARAHPWCVWLDGGGAREWSGTRSIIGWCDPDDVSLSYSRARGVVTRHAGGRDVVVGEDPFAVLAAEQGPGEQWFGYFGYAARPDLPAHPDASGMPDAVWLRPSHVRFFEHRGQPSAPPPHPPHRLVTSCSELYPPPCTGAQEPVTGRDKGAPQWYVEGFRIVQEHLHAGDSYEVNLTHRLQRESGLAPAQVYVALRALNPAPYAGFLQHDIDDARAWLLSSSPERFALIDEERRLTTKPIKGTTARVADPAGDESARRRLASDAKFRAENLMIVDLLRNDLSMVCEPGSVEVPDLMAVESYATVHQLVSTVTGRLREGVGTLDALRALFPAGSMTGAPKLRTMEIIQRVESTPRGAYAGAFGWISGDGPADLGVVIRSLMTSGDGTWQVGTGGGITVDSQVEEEYAETQWKAERVLRALDERMDP